MKSASLYSVTRRKTLWERCRIAENAAERARGLMFSRKVESPIMFSFPGLGRKRNALHSFFCPLFDAVFLDEAMRVVDVKTNIKPFNPSIISTKPCKHVIETAAGDCKKKGVGVGERLSVR